MEVARSKVIIVDDNISNLTLARNMLKAYCTVYPAPSAGKLFEILEKVNPDLILLDIEMPEVDGYEVMKRVKEDKRYCDIPVIFLTAKSDESSELRGFTLGAVDYVSKPFSGPLLLKRVQNQILMSDQKKDLKDASQQLKKYVSQLEVMVEDKVHQIVDLQNAVMDTVSNLVEFRDGLTGGHINRTQRYLKVLTDEMVRERVYAEEIMGWDMKYFISSAQLHDVGKIGISDLILNKPGRFTEEEFEIMKGHVKIGVDAIVKIMNNAEEHSFLQHALLIASDHHEKWDGSGYPFGKKEYGISLEGRLMAIADVYDALISKRPYKEPFSHKKACLIIEEGSGTHFDPLLIGVFKNVSNEFYEITKEEGQGSDT
jgi:putative two-component system response regulator